MKLLNFATFLLALSLCAVTPRAHAQHYALDTTFLYKGIDTFGGNIATGIIHRPKFVLPQVDNKKIVIVGNIYYASSTEVMRLNYDGSLDTSFNDSGKVVTTMSYIQSGPSAAILYDTSKILTASPWIDIAAGWEYMAVYNYRSDGSLNPAFGTAGIAKVALATPAFTLPISLGAQTDGKFTALGSTADPVSGYNQYGLLRLLANGTIDPSYGSGGRIIDPYPVLATPHATGSVLGAMARCGMMQPDNKFVVAGYFADSLAKYSGNQLFVVRHNMDGSPDLTFGYAGGITLIKDSSESFEITAMSMDSAGNLYFLAYYNRYEAPFVPYNYVVVKLDRFGRRVSSYGTNGVQYMQLPLSGYASAFSVQKNGRAVISGVYRTFTPGFMDRFMTLRLDSLGRFDTSFNTDGRIVTTRDSTGRDLCINNAVQPDGKLLVIGWDTLSATSICMRYTNYNNVLPSVSHAGIAEVDNSFTSHLFPNPVSNRELHIRYSNTGISASCTLELYNADGRRLDTHSQQIAQGDGDLQYTISSSLPTGTYFLVLRTGNSAQPKVHPITVLH